MKIWCTFVFDLVSWKNQFSTPKNCSYLSKCPYCAGSVDLPFLLVLLYALKSFCLHIRFPGFEFIIDREKDGIFGRDLFEVVNRELFFFKVAFLDWNLRLNSPFFRWTIIVHIVMTKATIHGCVVGKYNCEVSR